jgi:hypothetical protein
MGRIEHQTSWAMGPGHSIGAKAALRPGQSIRRGADLSRKKYYLLHIDCGMAFLQYILHIPAIATGAFRMDQNLTCGAAGDCARRMRG